MRITQIAACTCLFLGVLSAKEVDLGQYLDLLNITPGENINQKVDSLNRNGIILSAEGRRELNSTTTPAACAPASLTPICQALLQNAPPPVPVAPVATPKSGSEEKDMTVKIIDRQYHDNRYTYILPGYSPAIAGTLLVQGATLSLLLLDGRVAVVNCESKFQERFAGPQGNRRSCRIPIVDEIQAEFSGDNAKLKWQVGLDGRKIESETYKILGVLVKAGQ